MIHKDGFVRAAVKKIIIKNKLTYALFKGSCLWSNVMETWLPGFCGEQKHRDKPVFTREMMARHGCAEWPPHTSAIMWRCGERKHRDLMGSARRWRWKRKTPRVKKHVFAFSKCKHNWRQTKKKSSLQGSNPSATLTASSQKPAFNKVRVLLDYHSCACCRSCDWCIL